MANGAAPRHAEPYVGINGVNVWGDIKDYVTDISFADVASGETDSFDITVHDRDGHWINDWVIDKGTLLEAKIKLVNWYEGIQEKWIDCGEFLCDNLQIKGFPVSAKIKSLALPVNGTEKTKKWENISISSIAKDICKYLGCELKYYADDIKIESRQQSRQKDIDFLFGLCKEYGLGMKVYRHMIIIFSREKQDAAQASGTLNISDAENFTLTDSEDLTYTGARGTYKLKGSDTVHTYECGTKERMIVLSGNSSSLKECELKTKAALYDANAKMIKLKFSIEGGVPIYANTNYNIIGLGAYNGKYAIDKVTHSLSGKSMYKKSVEAHVVELTKNIR